MKRTGVVMRQAWWMVCVLLGAGAAQAQEEVASIPRLVVLPSAGNCGAMEKDALSDGLETQVQRVDARFFTTVSSAQFQSQLMALGEDPDACRDEKCWLGVLERADVAHALRAECMEVAGTRYVAVKLYSGRASVVMAQEDFQSRGGPNLANEAAIKAAALLTRELRAKLDGGPKEAPAKTVTVPALGARKVAVFTCEAPAGKPFAPDFDNTSPSARVIQAWLLTHGDAPVKAKDFKVPADSLGSACNLDSTRAAALAKGSGAAVVVWLTVQEHQVVETQPNGDKVKYHTARVQGRAYHAGLGRYGRLITTAARPSVKPILDGNAQPNAVLVEALDAAMVEWAQSLTVAPDEF